MSASGTDAPPTKLYVAGGDIAIDNNQQYKIKNSGGTAIQVLTLSTSNVLTVGGTSLGGRINFQEGYSTPTMVVSGQKVGIGTTTPGAKLNVAGGAMRVDNTASTVVRLHLNNSGTNDYASIYADTAAAYKNLILNPSGGNVGIGVTDPEKRLEVKSDTTYDGILIDVLSAPEIIFRDRGNSDTKIGTGRHGLDDFYIDTHSGNAFAIDGATRNVGIGTTTPSELLDIETGGGGGHVELNNPDSGGNSYVIGITDTAAPGYGVAGSLFIRDGGSSRFVLTSSGSVGIGTTSPAAPLDVPRASDYKVIKLGDDITSHYVMTGNSDHTLTLTCASYFQAEIVITAHQTNGGTYNNLYMRGIWSNNHTSHHWDEIEKRRKPYK